MKNAAFLMLLVFSIVILSPGCQTVHYGADEPDLVLECLDVWKEAILSKDIEKLRSLYSADFFSSEYGNRDQMLSILENAIAQGYLDTAQIDTSSLVVTVISHQATVSNITVSGIPDIYRFTLILKEVDGAWYVSGFER